MRTQKSDEGRRKRRSAGRRGWCGFSDSGGDGWPYLERRWALVVSSAGSVTVLLVGTLETNTRTKPEVREMVQITGGSRFADSKVITIIKIIIIIIFITTTTNNNNTAVAAATRPASSP
mgnify:CR=1 FL=1